MPFTKSYSLSLLPVQFGGLTERSVARRSANGEYPRVIIKRGMKVGCAPEGAPWIAVRDTNASTAAQARATKTGRYALVSTRAECHANGLRSAPLKVAAARR
jgi:hypothetical protein